jgi:DNA polymerase III epsilon subunit-like protein
MSHPEVYVSVDIEAAGPIPGEYSMLSLGACRVDAPENTFYSEFRPLNDNFVPEALNVSGLKLSDLRERGRDPAEAMTAFREWTAGVAKNGTPVFVGFNSSFDWAFVNWYFHKFLGENPFGIGAVDIKAYYMGLTGCPWEETKSSRLPIFLKPKRQGRGIHNALSDAIYQAGIFSRLVQERARLLNPKRE